MKRLLALLLALLMAMSFSGCTINQTIVSNGDTSLPTSSIDSSDESSKKPSSKDESSSKKPSSKDESSSKPNSFDKESSNLGSSGQQSGSSSLPNSSKPESSGNEQITPPNHDINSTHEGHYFYSQLSDIQKEYYEAIYNGVNKMQSSWILLGKATDDFRIDIAVAREAVLADHPEIFWVSNHYSAGTSSSESGEKMAMILFSKEAGSQEAYLVTKSEKERMVKALNEAVLKMVNSVTATTAYEIELELHDKLCEKVVYEDYTNDILVYTVYGALVNGKALCEGYSRAMQLLLSKFGILAIPAVGEGDGEGHMWNKVRIDGLWYNLDATWNDKEDEFPSYEYFNITDAQISLDHSFSKNFTELTKDDVIGTLAPFNINLPVCTATEYNYFEKTGFVLTKTNMDELIEYLVSESDKEVIEVGVSMAVREELRAMAQRYLSDLNTQLAKKHPNCGFKISGMGISNFCIQFYKANQTARG